MYEVVDASNVNGGLQFPVHTYLLALGTLIDTAELWRPLLGAGSDMEGRHRKNKWLLAKR